METWTSLKLIEWTTKHFKNKGVPNSRLDAEHLLASTLGCQRIDLYAQYDKPIQPEDLARYRTCVERRARREPLQYIMGDTEFYGLPIKVTPDVLIPRPETEGLVEAAMTRVGALLAAPSILEIGTGSGCIAIALAKNISEAQIVATDISKSALALAHENAQLNGVAEQIEFVEADLFPTTRDAIRFPLIVANPPYISSADLDHLQEEVRDWEPKQALDGGADGLDTYRRIVSELNAALAEGGCFVGEIGDDQARAIEALFTAQEWCESVEVKADLAGQDRIVIARRKAMG